MEAEHISNREFYRSPKGALPTGGQVRLRLSIADGGLPQWVRVIYRTDKGEEICREMTYAFSVRDSNVYEAVISVPEEPVLIWYAFDIMADGGRCFYGKGGLAKENPEFFQITVYDKEYETPDWFKKAVAYQIFPDRFYNGNEKGEFLGDRSDIIKRQWGDTPFYKAEQFGGEYKANDFYGGNLEGIIKKLPYLHELGITVIYLNPIFKASSNHKYDTGNYEEIDEMFGDEETFVRLCSEAKAKGIRIILDGVFNHTGDDSLYFNKYGKYDSIGAYQSPRSPYYSWYNFINYPEEYESWWGMTTLPQVNESSKSFMEYIVTGENSIIKKWLRLGASGWRLDVVDELPDFFVKEIRKAVKEVNPDAVIIGEVWEDASTKVAYGERREYFLGHELDSVMNYPMRDALIDGALCRIETEEMANRIMSLKENYPSPAYYSLLNIISTHDVERMTTVLGGAPSRHTVDKDFQAQFTLSEENLTLARRRMKQILGIYMTMPGVPCLFYGDELAIQGYGDPFCRSCFPWADMDLVDPHGEMRDYVKELISLRKGAEALSVGELDTVYAIGHVYGYIRSMGDEKYIVLVNFDNSPCKIRMDAGPYKIYSIERKPLGKAGFDKHKSENGVFFVELDANSFYVYQCNK